MNNIYKILEIFMDRFSDTRKSENELLQNGSYYKILERARAFVRNEQIANAVKITAEAYCGNITPDKGHSESKKAFNEWAKHADYRSGESLGDFQSKLESELCSIASELYPVQYRLLKTIVGIGAKTASVLLVSAKDLDSFESKGHLSSFIGLTSRHYQSGTSLNVNGSIVKGGNAYARSLLFSCSKSAIQWNKPCSDLYHRMRAKGCLHMVATVAVMHKLVKQAWGVAKSGVPFRNIVKK